jgi:hypothetical protein
MMHDDPLGIAVVTAIFAPVPELTGHPTASKASPRAFIGLAFLAASRNNAAIYKVKSF